MLLAEIEPEAIIESVPRSSLRQTQDLESLLRWAYTVESANRTHYFVPADLSMNWGLTVRPKKIRCMSQIMATHRIPFPLVVDEDAMTIHRYVQALGPVLSSLVIHHAKSGKRPDCMIGAEPRVEIVRRAQKKRKKKHRNRPAAFFVSRAIGPTAAMISDARARYTRWHEAMTLLAERLSRLEAFGEIVFEAPETPWEK
jgi:hypothetical protein